MTPAVFCVSTVFGIGCLQFSSQIEVNQAQCKRKFGEVIAVNDFFEWKSQAETQIPYEHDDGDSGEHENSHEHLPEEEAEQEEEEIDDAKRDKKEKTKKTRKVCRPRNKDRDAAFSERKYWNAIKATAKRLEQKKICQSRRRIYFRSTTWNGSPRMARKVGPV
jgi:hypothetical protein